MDLHLQRLKNALASATEGMSAQDLARHPEGKWSAAEVLEHLCLTYTGTVKGMERCLQAGRPLATPPTLKQRVSILAVTGVGYFPEGRQAPNPTRPRGMPIEQVSAELERQLVAMDEAISRCEERYGKRTRVLDHPVLGPLTPHQWRKFHWVHGRHHVKQIQRLRGART